MDLNACIFDLDGVIVDTAKYHYIAWKEIANQLGFDFTEQHNERLKGVSRMTSLNILLEVGGITLEDKYKEVLANKKNRIYREYILAMKPGEILPGVIGFLNDLKKHHIQIALGSASKNAMTILEKLQIAGFFDSIIDGTKVSQAKPNPEVFLKGAEALNVKPENCVVFEDAESGIEAAINGGMFPIGIGKAENLPKAKLLLNNFKEFSYNKLVALLPQ